MLLLDHPLSVKTISKFFTREPAAGILLSRTA